MAAKKQPFTVRAADVTLGCVVDVVENERQRAVLYSHLARTVIGEFLESDVGGPPLSITSPGGSVAPARRAVVEEVATELERLAARARGQMHRVLDSNVAVDVDAHPDDHANDKPGAPSGGTVTNDRPRSRG